MLNIIHTVARSLGFHFTPDNTIVPVMRLGLFHHFAGPGRFFIPPSFERPLAPITVGIRTGRYTLDEVVSQDSIAFRFNVVVRFFYDPRKAASREIQARIIHAPDSAWIDLVEDRTSQAVRRLASGFVAEELTRRDALHYIETNTRRFLAAEIKPIGLSVADNAVIIKEVRAPQKFKQTMLQVRQHQAVINVLAAAARQPEIVEQAIRAEFMNSLEGHPGNLTIFSPLSHAPQPSAARDNGGQAVPPLYVNGLVQGD